MPTSANKSEIFWVLAFPLMLLAGMAILLAGFITSETQYREGVERANKQILARLVDADLKEAAVLVLTDSSSCIRSGLAKVQTGPIASLSYVFSSQQRAVGEQIGYEQSIACYRERLKAMHTVNQSANWAALMGAAQ